MKYITSCVSSNRGVHVCVSVCAYFMCASGTLISNSNAVRDRERERERENVCVCVSLEIPYPLEAGCSSVQGRYPWECRDTGRLRGCLAGYLLP